MPIIYCGTIYDNLLEMGYSRILYDIKYHLLMGFISYCDIQK